MKSTAYKARSMSGAQLRVRQLQKQVEERESLLQQWHKERVLLAKLAADTPQFFNPFMVTEARTIRDRILREESR